MSEAPRIFMSYSHDDDAHRAWILMLSTRLVHNGVDVILDQWDLRLGADLPYFMETGLVGSNRIIAVCTEKYVEKANGLQGGVGYEKMILTGGLMRDITSHRIIPLIRNNPNGKRPTFLSTRLFIDFREDEYFEARYAELLREIHGLAVAPRPALGQNPFEQVVPVIEPKLSFASTRYASPALAGTVTFDYSNNNGRFALGAGDMLFETAWSGASTMAIHAYTDPPSIRTIALATGVTEISDVTDASQYDTSSRVRSPQLGEIVIWQNTAGYYAATRVEKLGSRLHNSREDSVSFSYRIAPNKGRDFRVAGRQ